MLFVWLLLLLILGLLNLIKSCFCFCFCCYWRCFSCCWCFRLCGSLAWVTYHASALFAAGQTGAAAKLRLELKAAMWSVKLCDVHTHSSKQGSNQNNRNRCTQINVYTYIHLCIYIYIYIYPNDRKRMKWESVWNCQSAGKGFGEGNAAYVCMYVWSWLFGAAQSGDLQFGVAQNNKNIKQNAHFQTPTLQTHTHTHTIKWRFSRTDFQLDVSNSDFPVLLYAAICCYKLLLATIHCYVLLYTAKCCYLLLFAAVCGRHQMHI